MTVEGRRSADGDYYLVGGFTFEAWDFQFGAFPAADEADAGGSP